MGSDVTLSPPISGTVPETESTAPEDADALAARAKQHYAEILKGERCAGQYWQLGCILNLLRRRFRKGTWHTKLSELEIDETRASRARRIAKRYDSETAVAGLTIREALGPARRKPPKTRSANEAPALADKLTELFDRFNSTALSLAHEARALDPMTASALLISARAAGSNLERLYDSLRLAERSAEAGGSLPLPARTRKGG